MNLNIKNITKVEQVQLQMTFNEFVPANSTIIIKNYVTDDNTIMDPNWKWACTTRQPTGCDLNIPLGYGVNNTCLSDTCQPNQFNGFLEYTQRHGKYRACIYISDNDKFKGLNEYFYINDKNQSICVNHTVQQQDTIHFKLENKTAENHYVSGIIKLYT